MNGKKLLIPAVILVLISLFISTAAIMSYALETYEPEAPVALFEFYKSQKYITNDNTGGSYSSSDNAYKLSATGAKASKDIGLTPNNSNDNTAEVIAERQAFMDYVEYVNPDQTESIRYMVLTYSNPDALPFIKTLYNEKNETTGTRGNLQIDLFDSDSKYYSVIVDVSGGKLLWRRSTTQRSTNIALFPFAALSSDDTNTYNLYLRSAAFTKTLEDAKAFCKNQITLGNTDGYHVNGDSTITVPTDEPLAVFEFDASRKYLTNVNVTSEYSTTEKAHKFSGTGAKASKDIGLTPYNTDNNTEEVIAERWEFMKYVEYVNPDQTEPIRYMVLTYKNPDNLDFIKSRYHTGNGTQSGSGYLQIDLFDSASEYYSVIVDVSGGKLLWRKSHTTRQTNIALFPFAALSSDDTNTYELYLRSAAFTKTLEDAKVFCENQVMLGNSDGYHVNGGQLVAEKPDITLDVSLDKHVYRMKAGDKLTLNTTVTSGASVSYTSSDTNVVTVDESGVVTAKAVGNAVVTAIAEYDSYKKGDSIKIFVTSEIAPLTIIKNGGQEAPADLPNITFLGDSITAGSQTTKIYHAYLAESLFIKSLNKGQSGSNIAGTGSSGQSSFIDRVSSISANSDMIFVLGGINDFGQNAGTLERFAPGVRTLIESLIENFSDKPIVFSTPLQNGGYFSITTNKSGESLEQYVTEIEKACAEYNIPVIKAWRAEAFKDFCTYDDGGNVSGYNSTYYADGVHPNAAGHAVMADFFKEQLEAVGLVKYVNAYNVTANAVGNGNITVGDTTSASHSTAYTAGTSVTLTAVSDTGYRLEGWYEVTGGKNLLLGRDNEYTFKTTSDIEIEARFIDETISLPVKLVASVGSENGTITVNGSTYEEYNGYADVSTSVELTAVAKEGYTFAYWKRVSWADTEVYLGSDETISVYPIGNTVYFTPVFVAEGTTVTLYLDAQGLILSDTEKPAIPPRLGYSATEWDLTSDGDIVDTYKPVYKRADSETVLTIVYADGSREEVPFKYDEKIVITGTIENAAWTLTVNGVDTIFSYNKDFTFRPAFTSNITLTERENSESAKAIVKGVSANYDSGAGLIKFVGMFELPDGAELVERGILLSNDGTVAADMEVDTPNIIVGRINADPATATKIFIINKTKVNVGDTWYGRAYIVYKQDGETKTLYADTLTGTANVE